MGNNQLRVMKKLLSVIIILFNITVCLYGQNADSYCYSNNIRNADAAFNQGDYEKALMYYMSAMECDYAKFETAVQDRIDLCYRMIQIRKCKVTIRSNPLNAKVFLDKQKIGKTPLDLALDTGMYKLKIRSAKTRTRSYKQTLRIYSGGSMLIEPNLWRDRHSVNVSDETGLWFTVDFALTTNSGWDLGAHFGHQFNRVVGYYVSGQTNFTQDYWGVTGGLSLRPFPYIIENWVWTLGAGYRYDLVQSYSSHYIYRNHIDFSMGVVRKAMNGGLSLLFECSLYGPVHDFWDGVNMTARFGLGWGFSE